MRVATFYMEQARVEGRIWSGPNAGGLCVVILDDGVRVVRHRDRLIALDEEAERALETEKKEGCT